MRVFLPTAIACFIVALLSVQLASSYKIGASFLRGNNAFVRNYNKNQQQPQLQARHPFSRFSKNSVSPLQATTPTVVEKDGVYTIEFEVAGQPMSFETGKIGRQADGAIVAKSADTIVYSTVCYQKEAKPVDFTPLRVDYFARFSSIGQTVGSFTKRDSRGDDSEILVARLIDRPIRPVIQDGWQHDTQILSWVLSYDKEHSPEALAICAASAALAISDIPMVRPIAGVEVGFVNGTFVVNPTKAAMKESRLSLTIAGTKQGILMIEGSADFFTEEQMMQAISVGHAAIQEISAAIDSLAAVMGKPKKLDTLRKLPASLLQEMDTLFGAEITKALSTADKSKRGIAVAAVEKQIEQRFIHDIAPSLLADTSSSSSSGSSKRVAISSNNRDDSIPVADIDEEAVTVLNIAEEKIVNNNNQEDDDSKGRLNEEEEASELKVKSFSTSASGSSSASVNNILSTSYGYDALDVTIAIKKLLVRKLRMMVLQTGRRSDGRGVEDVRPISTETQWLPGAHGSALFTRGETQSIATATLGGKTMSASSETLDGMQQRRFYLQYRFPPSSVGEVGRVGGQLSRREVGHGNLAERALLPAIPDALTFPYSIRGESLITESSGSSSMASVCGVCLAMLDAGVPLKRSIAGVAMGLILPDEEDGDADSTPSSTTTTASNKPVILTDILGLEDALGTMDFKVAGDEEGITAFQLDIKCEGLTLQTLDEALQQAKRGRLHILQNMNQHLSTPRPLNAHVPKIVTLSVPSDTIGKIIGPKGKTVQGLIETYGIDNIHLEDDGSIQIVGKDSEQMEATKAAILAIVEGAADNGGKGNRRGNRGDRAENSTGTAPEKEVGPPPEVGMIYRNCPIVGVHAFGVFVQVTPGHDGLVHISELDIKRVASVEGAGYAIGNVIDVKHLGVNDKGQMRLSRRAVLLRDSGIDV